MRYRAGVTIAAVAWLWSLWLPALQLGGGIEVHGWEVLRAGWRAGAAALPSWYANPLFLITIAAAFAGRKRIAAGLATATFVLALSSLGAKTTLGLRGYDVENLVLLSGYFVWLISITGLFLWAARHVAARVFARPFGTGARSARSRD